MRQEPRQALRTIKSRVKINAFTYTPYAFEAMVDRSIDEEDVQRAAATGWLIETREDRGAVTHYVLRGFAMNDEEMVLVCRLLRRTVEIADLYRT